MIEQIEDRLNEVPEDLRQGPVIFAAAALVGPFVLVLLAGVAGPSLSSPLLTWQPSFSSVPSSASC